MNWSATGVGQVLRARAGLAAVLVIALSLTATACKGSGEEGQSSDSGPLSASTFSGMKAVYAPRQVPYSVTFGSFLLCRDSAMPTDEIVLDRVRFETVVHPQSVEPVLREVPNAAERSGDPTSWTPIGGVLGSPGHFSIGRVSGHFTDSVKGHVVDVACSDLKDVDNSFLELEVVMQVDDGGADVNGFTIDYHAGAQQFELVVPWRMVGCGSTIDPDLCTPRESRKKRS